MKFTRTPTPKSKLYSNKLSPMLMVDLTNINNPAKGYTSLALIDSGADYCLINSNFASSLLDIDYTKSNLVEKTWGIEAGGKDVYFHDVWFEIKSVPNSKMVIPFGFVDSKAVNILLGRHVFFENFKVNFDQKNNYFEVKLA